MFPVAIDGGSRLFTNIGCVLHDVEMYRDAWVRKAAIGLGRSTNFMRGCVESTSTTAEQVEYVSTAWNFCSWRCHVSAHSFYRGTLNNAIASQ